jgi:hypothetical protein
MGVEYVQRCDGCGREWRADRLVAIRQVVADASGGDRGVWLRVCPDCLPAEGDGVM